MHIHLLILAADTTQRSNMRMELLSVVQMMGIMQTFC